MNLLYLKGYLIYSQFSRCVTARGSCTGLVTVGPTKACKSVLFTNRFPDIQNKEHLVDEVDTLCLH